MHPKCLETRLYNASGKLMNFGLPKTRDVVPESEIRDNCGLHNNVLTGKDLCDQ